jgi:hypothetical protein
MKTYKLRPAAPLSKQTISDALDRATSHLVRAEYQFKIPGPRRYDHWTRALEHLYEARGAFEEAAGVLEALLAALSQSQTDDPG